jgi:Rod binding domain-containing protein
MPLPAALPVGSSPASPLAPIADTALPADIRTASESDKNAYKAAMGFESMLVQNLLSQMSSSAAGDDSASDDGDDSGAGLGSSGGLLGGGGPWASTLQETLAQQLTSGGGIGLARQLYSALKPAADGTGAAAATTPATNPGATA